ncbi:hypothetical protein E1I18_00725 [Mycoplasmopsis mucosicanis]|uniref:Uncharacterized protein n=1 Tax=Mycoplasmopsis mucosicanis TaxID=458208 RepID=A0A507SV86_9BACT|nr:hypothetical protein [Mycoplasmopsis mucosicanis]TQC54114.1 hypothetical protein E1I18_00725 [Mycoplasmopsis mucosicanis]
MTNYEQDKKRRKKLIIASSTLLATSVATTAVVISIIASRRKAKESKINKLVFAPNVEQVSSKVDALEFKISNLNLNKNKGKQFEVRLLDKKSNKEINKQTFTINEESQNVNFSGLNENTEYTLEIFFDAKSIKKQDFRTAKKDQSHEQQEVVFAPEIKLLDTKYNLLSFEISNLNLSKNKDKKYDVQLLEKNNNKEVQKQTFSITQASDKVTFSNLNENTAYVLNILFNGKSVKTQEFETSARPKIVAQATTPTSAIFSLLNLHDYQDSLDKIEITIKKTTSASDQDIVIKASDLKFTNGSTRIDLEALSIGLEPGSEYSASVILKEANKTTKIVEDITFNTTAISKVAYRFIASATQNKIVLYGLKQQDKKVVLEYKLAGSSEQFKKVETEAAGKNEVILPEDLGFDNKYEFQIKYEGESEQLEFEGDKKVGEFNTTQAPQLVARDENGLTLKLENVSKNINKENLYIRYKDKDKANGWSEKALNQIKGYESGDLKLDDLEANKVYQAQLIYKKSKDSTSQGSILNEVEFRIKQSLAFDIAKSLTASQKVLLSFKDNSNLGSATPNYSNIKVKYTKFGESASKEVELSAKQINGTNYAQSLLEGLDQNTTYFWSLVDSKSDKTLAKGSFKTGKASGKAKAADNTNAYETNESNLIAVENRLLDGVLVSIKNTFGYLRGEGKIRFPREINIKYYPKNEPSQYITEKIQLTLEDIKTKDIFTRQIKDLDNMPYVFEVEYTNGKDSNNKDIVVSKKFEINYKLPEVEFDNAQSKLKVKHLDSLNGKTITVKYSSSAISTSVEGSVQDGILEVQLSNLRSQSTYNVSLEIKSEDVEFVSSLENEKRSEFYGTSSPSANKIVITSEFTTQEQQKSIYIKHEERSTLFDTVNIYPILEGFKEYAGKQVQVKVGTKDELDKVKTVSGMDSSVKGFTATIDQDGRFDNNNNWINDLVKNKHYEIRVYEVKGQNLEVITQVSYDTPDFEVPKVQKLEIVGSNTDNPGFRIENVEAFKELIARYNGKIGFKAQRISENKEYKEFNNIKTPQTFSGNSDHGFNHLKFNNKSLSDLGTQDKVLTLEFLTNKSHTDSNFKSWFTDKSEYQIILTVTKDGKEYVVASNTEDDLIYINYNYKTPKFDDNQTTNELKPNSKNQTQYTDNITFKLLNLEQYTSTGSSKSKLRGFYIKSDDALVNVDPTQWHSAGDVTVDSANNTGSIKFEGLELNTYYEFVLVDDNDDVILSKHRYKTVAAPKLRNTTQGDTLIRYKLSDLKGAQEIIKPGKYKIKYGLNGMYDHESNEVTIGDSINLSTYVGDLAFTLENGLTPNTTYNFKLVNENGDVILGYQDIFRTNKSQSEETIVGNDFAVVKLLNPSYTLREGSYSIARSGTADGEKDKTILDVLKMQYSKSPEFTEYQEFSVALSENEAKILNIKFSNLDPNTKYYYRLVKGVVKADVIKNEANSSAEPQETLDTDKPVLKGEFTTFNVPTRVAKKDKNVTITFENLEGINDQGQVFLNFKKQNQSNVFEVNYDYKVHGDKVIFELSGLEEGAVYEYSLVQSSNKQKVANGSFSAPKKSTQVEARDLKIDDTHHQVLLRNLDDYVGKKVRIRLIRTNNNTTLQDITTTLTNENGEFIWDFEDLEVNNTYKYEVILLDENKEVQTLASKTFKVEFAKYEGGGDKTVSTNVKALGNYEMKRWYTLATLQELYANHENWQQKVQQSLEEIAIYGTEVAASNAYGWHKLIAQGSKTRYFKVENGKLIYEYIFVQPVSSVSTNNKAKLKGIKFELRLVGNTIQVMIDEAKAKSEEISDKRISVASFKWSELDENLTYKSSNGLINQSKEEVLGKFINVGGFKFVAKTFKRGPRDFSNPQILRYSIEQGDPALNDKIVSQSGQTALSFAKFDSPKQQSVYGTFDSNTHNYDVLYNKYKSKNNDLLPFNANFLISPSIYPGLGLSAKSASESGFVYNEKLRAKFFRTLKEVGLIRFAGSDVYNKGWIKLNGKDVIMFADELNAFSDKYLKEFPLAKRLIWRDGNQLKGLRITLSDAANGNGAALGMLDDFVYYLDLDKNKLDLKNLSWDVFTKLATKHTTHKYMNPNSPSTSIAGIKFVSKDEKLITSNPDVFINPQSTQPTFDIESNSTQDQNTRKLRLFNAEKGQYKIKIEYPIYFPTAQLKEYKPVEKTFEIDETNSGFFEYDLTKDLDHNTQYKVTISKDDKVLKTLTGINADIPNGFTWFKSKDVVSGILPKTPNNWSILSGIPLGFYFSHGRLGLGNYNNLNAKQIIDWIRSGKYSFLIGSTKLDSNGEMRYKWSFKVQAPSANYRYANKTYLQSKPARQILYAAAISDDKSKIVIVSLVSYVSDLHFGMATHEAREHILTEEQKKNLENLDLSELFAKSSKKLEAYGSNNKVSEDDFKGNHTNRVALFGIYIANRKNSK